MLRILCVLQKTRSTLICEYLFVKLVPNRTGKMSAKKLLVNMTYAKACLTYFASSKH